MAGTPGALSPPIGDPARRAALAAERDRLLDFYQRPAYDPAGGFHWLDATGRPDPRRGKPLWLRARMVYCFALASLLGRPGAADVVRHGLAFLAGPLRDPRYGGWYTAATIERPACISAAPGG